MDEIRNHPDFHNAGMILCHNGVVRATSRDGRKVNGLRVETNHLQLQKILEQQKKQPGIVDILVEINEGRDLKIGEDVMFLVVAGDIREHVIAALTETLYAIKSTVTQKTEFFEA
jgi:molybdopterin synthase catalytic subunit